MKLSVLMPVYNESRTLRTIVQRVLDAPVDMEIELVAVDDASSDGSWPILLDLQESDSRIRVFRHETNRGKGAAIRTAIEHIDGEIAIVQDADLEYNPAEYPIMLKPIIEGKADAVYGSRFASSPERRVLLFWHSLGNKVLTALCNAVNDLNLTDMETCYKAVRTDVLKALRLQSERFGIEPEITTRLAQWGARIYEVPITYDGRSYAEGKNIGWRDGVQAVWLILNYKFFDTKFSRHAGHTTLEGLAGAPRLNRWIMDQFKDRMGQKVFEAGSGVGNLTKLMLDRQQLVTVDVDPFYTDMLTRKYGHLENTLVSVVDLQEPGWSDDFQLHSFDSVVCVNVLEHLEHDDVAVAEFWRILSPGGRALVLVPAHSELYGPTDEAIGHHRRYDLPELKRLFEANGFELDEIRPFNRAGVFGWQLNRALGSTSISPIKAKLFDWAVGPARVFEEIARPLRGLSWVVEARKR